MKLSVINRSGGDDTLVEKVKLDIVFLGHEVARSGENADACIILVTPKSLADTLVDVGTALADTRQTQVPIIWVEAGPNYMLGGSLHRTYAVEVLKFQIASFGKQQ